MARHTARCSWGFELAVRIEVAEEGAESVGQVDFERGEGEVEGHGPEHDQGFVFGEVEDAGEEVAQDLLVGGFRLVNDNRGANLVAEDVVVEPVEELANVRRGGVLEICAEL